MGRVRDNNEDAATSVEPDDAAVRAERGNLYLVADGMGGHAAGEVASQYAVDKVSYEYYDLPWEGAERTLAAAIQRANEDIYVESNANGERHGMGTTLVAAAVFDDQAVIAHLGDSRAYLLRDGRLRRLTRDHSRVQELVDNGTITPEQAKDHPDRSMLTRNLGHRPSVEPDIATEPLQPGDRLLLCSDGLWGALSEDEIARLAEPGSAAQAVADLVAAANAAGGPDNIGVAVVCAGNSSTSPTRRVAITRQGLPLARRPTLRTPIFAAGFAATVIVAATAGVHFARGAGQSNASARSAGPLATAVAGPADTTSGPGSATTAATPAIAVTPAPSGPTAVPTSIPPPEGYVVYMVQPAEGPSTIFEHCRGDIPYQNFRDAAKGADPTIENRYLQQREPIVLPFWKSSSEEPGGNCPLETPPQNAWYLYVAQNGESRASIIKKCQDAAASSGSSNFAQTADALNNYLSAWKQRSSLKAGDVVFLPEGVNPACHMLPLHRT